MPRTVTPLKLAIVSSGRTQRDIAAAVGLNEVEFSKVVNGHRTPSVDLAVVIAYELGREVVELWPGQGQASDHTQVDPTAERLAA